jgi:teichuronic acid biosynthesis glycosyltransferase TuaG
LNGVSVIIPNYNHGRFLSQCLESVIHQTLSPAEILIGDGGSTDGSIKLLDQYVKNCPDLIKVFKFKRLAVNPTIEFLIKAARGDYIAFIGADDFWDARYLEILTKQIGNSCVAYCDLFIVWPKKKKITVIPEPDYDPKLLMKTNYIAFEAAIIKRDCLNNILKKYGKILDDSAGIPSDWDLWQKMNKETCAFVHVPKPLSYFRKHRQQSSSRLQHSWDLYKIYRRSNTVTLPYLLKMLVGETFVSFLQLYNLHLISDFLSIPINRKKGIWNKS